MPSPSETLIGVVVLATVATAWSRWRFKGRRRVGSALPREQGCIYLDYASTTCIYPDVADAMLPYLYRLWGNPSSGHTYGLQSRKAVAEARARVAALVGAKPAEIVWCSCGSEADNWALEGSLRKGRTHIVVSAIEHPAILECVAHLERQGRCDYTVVGCDQLGFVSPDAVCAAVRPGKTAVVSIMLANNEVGAIQDVAAISRLVKAKDPKVLVHSDAAQAVGKIDVDVDTLGVDLLTIVGHKFGAPKGVAALYARDGVAELPSLLHGGGQERGLRAGTEAVPSLVALGEAAQIWLDQGPEIMAHSTRMRDRLLDRLKALSPRPPVVNGPLGDADVASSRALPNVLSVAVEGVPASEVLATLKTRVAASASAACHTDSTAVSPVLAALRVPTTRARGTLRLSVGRHTTRSDVDQAATLITQTMRELLVP